MKFYRKTNRYSTGDLANIIGVAQGTIRAYERGVSVPTKEVRETIYQKFGIQF